LNPTAQILNNKIKGNSVAVQALDQVPSKRKAIPVEEVKRVLSEFTENIPHDLRGPDKVIYLLENTAKLPAESKVLLKEYFDQK